jgi:hypothetical protein
MQQKPNSKAERLVVYRADQNLRTTYKLKLSHPTEGEDDHAAALKERRRRRKKTPSTTQPAGKTTTELLLKYQHQDWMLEEYLKLGLIFYCS